ncbi:MAG TPA: carbonic anhydrase [Phycisphaerales bacterium]|nr:carbonic anhydrase [Phycisphaerales bacterium]
MPEAGYITSQPFEYERIGAAAIYCSDGRYNEQFDEFLHNHLKLPRYDRLVVPGGPAVLAGHFSSYRDEEVMVEQLRFLIEGHELDRVVMVAHKGCGFYRKRLMVSERRVRVQQEEDLVKAAARVRAVSRNVVVSGFIADLTDGDAAEKARVVIEPVDVA